MNNSTDFRFSRYSELEYGEKIQIFNEVYLFLYKLNFEYPNFTKWYSKLFEEKSYEIKKEREIIISRYNEKLAGAIILKKTEEENKICTLKVDKKYRNNGIARKLFELGFEWLEDDKPLATCHYIKKPQYDGLLKYFGFELAEKRIGYYGIFNMEYAYNGVLPKKKTRPSLIEQIDIDNILRKMVEEGKVDPRNVWKECLSIWYKRDLERIRVMNRK